MATTETINVIDIQTKKAEDNVKTLKQRIKELKDEIAELDEESEDYQKKLNELGGLMRQQADITEHARYATSDLGDRVLATTKVIQGGIGAITGITSALSLFGVEISENDELQQKLLASIALLSSIDAIDSAIDAFKGLKTSIMSTTVAQKALNLVMKANPITLVATAVGALATALIGYKIATAEATEEANKLEEANKTLHQSFENIEADLNTYKEKLNMGKSEWLDKVKKKWEEINNEILQTSGLQDTLISRIKESINQADEETEALLKGVLAYEKLQQAEFEKRNLYQLASEERKKEIDENLKLAEKELLSYYKVQTAIKKVATTTKTEIKEVVEEYNEFDRQRNENQIAFLDKTKTEIDYYNDLLLIEQAYLNTLEKGTEEYDKQLISIKELINSINEMKINSNISDTELDYENTILTKKLELLQNYYNQKQLLGEKDIEKAKEIEEQYNRNLFELQQLEYDNMMNLLIQQHELGLLTKQEFTNQMKELEISMTETQIAESERRKEVLENEKLTLIETEKILQSQMLELSSSVGSLLGGIADNLDEETTTYKNLKAAEAIINTLSASVAAFSGVTSSTGGWGIALAIAKASAVIATGMATVRQIYAVNTNGGANNTTNNMPNMGTTATNVLERNYTNTRLTDGSGIEVDLNEIAKSINDKKVILSLNEFHTADKKYTNIITKSQF
jgi:archaellum component FlaC